MDKYKILFIDEERDSFDDFLNYVEKSSKAGQVNVVTELPLNTLESMIEKITEINPDAIITDYLLNEKKTAISYNVPYNGAGLVKRFLKIKEKFPCFVLTAFDYKAINEIEDVNKIYVKNILHESKKEKLTNAKVSFLDRVVIQIQHYKSKLQKNEKELLMLLDKKKKGLTNYHDEQRIIELDSLIERSIDGSACIPKDYKRSSNTDRLRDLLNKVNELINKVERGNGKKI